MATKERLLMIEIEPALKHATVFDTFDNLAMGESFVILNNHDPKPLYYQLMAERGNVFSWIYLKQGPLQWEVEIKKHQQGITVAEIAASDIRKADVLKKHGIDFCCGGRKSLQQVCDEKQLDYAGIENELNNVEHLPPRGSANDYERWQPDFLVDYIYNQHHLYYYSERAAIADLCEKVTSKHNTLFPNLSQIHSLYFQLQSELNTHFLKEERVLFPFIKALVKAKHSGNNIELQQFPEVSEPIQMMEAEHEMAGNLLKQLRAATNNFTPPENVCNTFKLLYKKLADLEADLHQHIHLENNVLFPKALQLEKEVTALQNSVN